MSEAYLHLMVRWTPQTWWSPTWPLLWKPRLDERTYNLQYSLHQLNYEMFGHSLALQHLVSHKTDA